MSETTSVRDVVQSAGRACAQQGADTLSRHPHSVTKAGTLQLFEEAETEALQTLNQCLIHCYVSDRLVLKIQSPSSFYSVTK